MAFECIGLLAMLDQGVFSNFMNSLKVCLKEIDDDADSIEKAIASKSTVDGLIIHCNLDEELFRLVTQDFILQSVE